MAMKKEKIFLLLIAVACFSVLGYLSVTALLNHQPVETQHLAASASVMPKPTVAPYTGTLNPLTATLDELDTLPGIGPSTAQAFHDYLNIPGNTFIFAEDITNVKGIGAKKLQDILPYLWLPAPAEPSVSPLFPGE